MTLLGTFSPYMVVHKSSVVKIDPSIPFEVACLVGCGVTTGYGSAVRSGDIRPGDDVVDHRHRRRRHVGALQGAVNAGARNIFVDRAGRVEARRGAEVRCDARLSGHRRAMAGIAEVTHGLMAKQGHRHRR